MPSMTLQDAVAELNERLPGWWWLVKSTKDGIWAACGPDGAGPDIHLVEQLGRLIEEISVTLKAPATPAEALEAVMKKALAIKAKHAPPMTLDAAIAQFTETLPGWWWHLGDCSLTADASCGPEKDGPDADLLDFKGGVFQRGFSTDLRQPATPAEALMLVMKKGIKARVEAKE